MSRCESYPLFQGLIPSPTWGSYWRLGRTKTVCFGSSKPSATHPEDRDGVSPWNVGELSPLDAAFCPRTFYWITFCAVGNKFVYIREVEGRFANIKMLDSCLFATVSSWPKITISVRIKWRGCSAICSLEWAVVCFGLLFYQNNQIISYQLSIACPGVITTGMLWVRWKHL